MPKLSISLLACCVAFASCHTTHAASRAAPSDDAAIRQVVESFRTSLIAKDKAAYLRLFFSDRAEDIGWQSVSEDTRLVHLRTIRPDAIKARRHPGNTFIGLIDEVVATNEPREETFADIRIDTDGEIASVAFDYVYLENGRRSNWGREMWQLVRTEGGWKIFSVIYTVRDEWSVGDG